jgi:hypothetical protein
MKQIRRILGNLQAGRTAAAAQSGLAEMSCGRPRVALAPPPSRDTLKVLRPSRDAS